MGGGDLKQFMSLICSDEVFDASRGCSADKFHKVLEEGTLKVKTSYW